MIRIIAMIGDAGASARLRSAIAGSARLEFVRDVADLAERIKRVPPDVIVLGAREAAMPGVQVIIGGAADRFRAMRVLLACRLDSADMRTWPHLRSLDVSDIVLVFSEPPAMTRERLLSPKPGHVADVHVRRLICSHAPAWIHPYVDWCAQHDGATRPDVRQMAKIGNMRRETLARLFKARGVCRPNHMISWILLLRATARMDLPNHRSLAAIAHELGVASGGALGNLFVRRAHQTPTQACDLGVTRLAERALRDMFSARREHPLDLPTQQPVDRRHNRIR
ncbi:MAG: hypothetical protein ACREND_07495 [Gemmatimonadaceae bacterium]